PRPVGGGAGRLVALAPEHLRAAHPRVRLQLLGGARLANSRLAHEQTIPPRPAKALSNAVRNRASSGSRPTNTPRAGRASGLSCAPLCRALRSVGSTRSSAASASPAEAGRSSDRLASRRRINSSRSGGQASVSQEGATGGVFRCWVM